MSVADELEKLHQLQVQGVITAEELATQKAKLLAEGAAPVDRRGRVIDPVKAAKAKKLVTISHALGWGGIGVAFLIGPILAGAVNVPLGVAFIVLGAICAIVGAVLGQVGRAMQGRAM